MSGPPQLPSDANTTHVATRSDSTPIATLPPELMLQIAAHFDFRTLARASMVSSKWFDLCRDPQLWRNLCLTAGELHDFSNANSHSQSGEGGQDARWYKLYKRRVTLDRNWRQGRFLNFQVPHQDHRREGHTGPIYATQMHGNYLVSGGMDMTVRIWSLQACRLIAEPLSGHQSEVLCLRFDPCASQDVIMSGSKSAELIVWRFSTASMITRTQIHDDAVLSIRFNTRVVVTSSADRTIKVWDRRLLCLRDQDLEWARRKPLRVLRGHEGSVNSIDLSGDTIVSASGDNTLRVWSVAGGVCVRTVEEPRSIACVQLDGSAILCGGRHQSIAIYDSGSEPFEERLSGDRDVVRALRSRMSRGVFMDVIVSGSYDGRVIIWTRRKGERWQSRALQPEEGRKGRPTSTTRSCALQSDVYGQLNCLSSQSVAHEQKQTQSKAGLQGSRQFVGDSTSFHDVRTSGSTARYPAWIFGVDFDERRLVCCTEQYTLFGMDFANGDPELQ